MWAEVGSAFTYEATNSATKDAINTLENKKMKRELTVKSLILAILYGWAVFFCLGIIIRFSISFLYLGTLTLDMQDFVKTSVLSAIAGISGGVGSWIFAKIDEYKTRKSPPSDPKP
ncbi:hypothetical protein CQP30_00200 [Yersinia pestis]|uniref:hypothetical protein n=2 Tax=Yersinia pseudotuberculosis complex TaxID=1649845 RepID=UPI000365E546|nr:MULTISPECIES: hypothetical protein [Yersinia pseudotuberculosis complex]ERP72779.1 hypothetical protein L328_12405 [Yersinia pestis 24H]ANW14484.1 hypothetical protein BAY22_11115 [Yersinia pestis]AYX20312.1 hypothetical protein EGX46_13530 [Yersinia pestis]AYX25609.1 hypothetical protein EGX74_18465 [Yersinia pestis]ERP73593.1 hypothetical protein L326_12270 [Yersinia pestis 113]